MTKYGRLKGRYTLGAQDLITANAFPEPGPQSVRSSRQPRHNVTRVTSESKPAVDASVTVS